MKLVFQGIYFGTMVLKFSCSLGSLGEIDKTGFSAKPPKFLIQWVLGGTQEFAFLTSFWVLLMLLIQEQYFENHYFEIYRIRPIFY